MAENEERRQTDQSPLLINQPQSSYGAIDNQEASTSSNTSKKGNSGLTVRQKSRVETELQKHEETYRAPSKWITFMKWVVGFLLTLALTFCLVFSKISIILIANDLHQNVSSKPTPTLTPDPPPPTTGIEDLLQLDDKKPLEATLAMIIVALLIPLVAVFLRSVWCGFSAEQPWPTLKAIIAGVLASVFESFGVALFVLEVLPSTQPSISVSLMNGVFLAHAAYILFQTFHRADIQGRYCLALTLALPVVLTVAGILLALFCYHCGGLKTGTAVWAIPVSLVCLSIVWCSPIQHLQLMPRITGHIQAMLDNLPRLHLQLSEGQDAHGVNGRLSDTDLETMVATYPAGSARWKMTIITSMLKMVKVPGFLLLLTWGFHPEIDLTKLPAGFSYITSENPLFPYLMTTLACSCAGYLFGWMACTTAMRPAFFLPLILATPIAFFLTLYIESCKVDIFKFTTYTSNCSPRLYDLPLVVPGALCLYLAQLLSIGYYVYKSNAIILLKESQLFWLPGYNGAFLEQYMLLNRKTTQMDVIQEERLERARLSRVFICTTMYREADYEMEQLLRSLDRINRAKQQSDRHFQAHIFFDNGVRQKHLTQFALQLVVIAGKTLGLQLKDCSKIQTPYGMQLRWVLPTVSEGKRGMDIVIHLKDNLMVKNKKRWSQVMYMSYVLDYFIKDETGATDNNTLILTTDADVDFTPASVEALLDLMTRDDKVGAVCARSYPMGFGPLVWYQVFDYAIGHWFQKTANHVLGTVLCCPGCFSMYRAEALRHVLPTYATGVTHAFEFLTKDMGEDRWLCTLLVQSGWRLEYSAAADNKTYCPMEFDEFFKQRRRWVASTLANLVLLLREWKTVYYLNNNISLLFLFYQAILIFSTLISPAVCILVITGGVYYALGIPEIITALLMYGITSAYFITCRFASPFKQLMAAKVLAVAGVIVMAAVTMGTAVQIVVEISPEPKPTSDTFSILPTGEVTKFPMPISVTALFVSFVVMVFVVAALLHLPEAYCLLHGVWYLWCLPAGFIILLIYSIVNLNGCSWGTREEKPVRPAGGKSNTSKTWRQLFRNLFKICLRRNETSTQTLDLVIDDEDSNDATDDTPPGGEADAADGSRFHSKENEKIKVSEWLSDNLRDLYAGKLEDAGYDDTSFLVGMTEAELTTLGVKDKAHRQALLDEISTLREPEIEPFVPETVEEWLTSIGLQQYESNFKKMQIVSNWQLEILKTMSEDDIKKEIGIHKAGHLKRLLLAIKNLRYPTESEMLQSRAKVELERLKIGSLGDRENTFWTDLRDEKLLPTSTFTDDNELKEKLSELRDSVLVMFGVANTLWILFILTMAPKSQLDLPGTNALGVSFLILFGFVLAIQFLSMLIHRLSTFVHLIACAPSKWGDPYRINWSWTDNSPTTPASDRRHTSIIEETVARNQAGEI